MREYTAPTKLWNKGFILVFIANLFQHMGQQTITTLVPKYAASMGAAATIVGIASSAFAISALLSKPITSPAFQVVNRRNIYMAASAILLAAYVIFYIAPNVNWLIAGRLLQGIGVGVCAPISLSIACDNLPEGSFAQGVSIFSLGQAFGQAVGPSVGLRLSSALGYKNTFLICMSMIVICIVTQAFVSCKPPAPDAKYRIRLDVIVEKKAIPSALIMLFCVMAYACIPSFLAIYGDLLGLKNDIGLYFTVYAVAILVLRFATKGLADKLGYRVVLLGSLACFAVTFVLFSVSRSMPGFIAAAIFAALGYGLILPNAQALCMTSVPAEKRSVGSNTLYLGQDIGQFAGPWLAGMLIDSLVLKGTASGATAEAAKISAYSTAFLAIISTLVIAAVVVVLVTKKKKED